MRDFVPVASLMNSELVLVVPQRSPVNTLKELIALAKAKPGTLNYGSRARARTTTWRANW